MRFRILAVCALLASLPGCARKVDKAYDPVVIARVPVPTALTATVADRRIDLAWNVDAADLPLVQRYLIYRADSGGSTYEVLDSTTLRNYSDDFLANDVRYAYRVAVRSTQGVEGEPSSSVSAVPTLISVRINADSLFTSRLTVQLESTAAGASFMRITNDTTQPGTWIQFRTTQSWTLTPGAGLKRVFVQFRMNSGTESSGWTSDAIEYDDRAQILSVVLSDSVLAPGASLNVFVSTGESGGTATYSIGSRANQKLFDDGVLPDATPADGIYSGVYVASAQDLFEDSPLTARFKDRAGNDAPETAGPWGISVRQPPDAPVWLSIEPVAGDYTQLDLTWALGQSKPFSQLLLRRDTVRARGLNAGVVRSFTAAATTSVRDTGLSAGTTYYYTLQILLSNGQSALSVEDSGKTVLDLPPLAVTAAVSPTADSSLSLTWTRSAAFDFADYRVYRADAASALAGLPSVDLLVRILTGADSTSYAESGLTRSYYYRVFVFDRGGLSAGSNTVWGPKVFGP